MRLNNQNKKEVVQLIEILKKKNKNSKRIDYNPIIKALIKGI